MDASGIPQNGEIITDGDDSKLRARFYVFPVKNNFKSLDQGRAIFDDKDYIEIRIPGDRNTVINQEATDEHKERFPQAWARYQNGKGDEIVGTPVEHWGILTPSQVMELKALNIPTVDLLAEVADGFLGKFMGLRELRKKAQEFIAASKDASVVTKLQNELMQRDEQIASQGEQIAALAEAVKAMQEASPEAAAAAQKTRRAPKGQTEAHA